MKNDRTQNSIWFRAPRAFAGSVSVLALAAAVTLMGCRQPRAPAAPASATAPASFSPEGRWRSSKVGVLTVHVQPDGSLLVIDPHRGQHPFQRVAPERWQARVSREIIGTFDREEDQLVFRTTPTPEAQKPIAQKNGVAIVHTARRIEDRMTRVPDTRPESQAPK